ncbi:hypothetical protein FRC02_006927 [Tulasnella sp. 418]|nr:hypothetical protein FRC02_006927 [Tulasnella sp. 418]
MDSFPLPIVKGIAGAGVEVIKMARTIQLNKKGSVELQKRSASFRKKAEEIPVELQQSLERLVTNFQEVATELRVIQKRSGKGSILSAARALIYLNDNVETLKYCSEKLDWAIKEFGVASKVNSSIRELERSAALLDNQGKILKGQTEILETQLELRKGQDERLAAMKTTSTPTAPSNLPSMVMPASPKIFGRQDYITNAIKLLLSGGAVHLAILGPGGIGKTSVALKIAHDSDVMGRFGQNIYWLQCEQATTIPLLVELLAKSLRLPASTSHDRLDDVVTTLMSSKVLSCFPNGRFRDTLGYPRTAVGGGGYTCTDCVNPNCFLHSYNAGIPAPSIGRG